MPISAEQWRVAVGKMNANKSCPATRHKSGPMTPCEGTRRKPSAREERREYVANILTVLFAYFLALRSLVSDLSWSERDENDGSTKKMKAKGKGMHGSLVMLLRLLLFITALLLLMGGDVERNPGPPKRDIINVINSNIGILTDTISLELPYFSSKFIESGFVTQTAKTDIFTKQGISNREKASRLLDCVTTNYKIARQKQEWVDKFVAVFSSQDAYKDLALMLTGETDPPVAATGDKTLSLDNAATVLEELYEARNHSRFIGLKLGVPQHVINIEYSASHDRLYNVIVEYLKQVEPRPTWRAIVDMLKSPLVNLPHLAKKIEAKYCVAPTTPQRSELSATAHDKTESHVIEEKYIYNFVERPSEDFFCPVTKDLLLQPYMTSCCGHHLSDEAVTKIQGMGGACPICMMTKWTAVLDKYIRRQIHQLRMFCRRKGKGCEWEGELSELEHHMKSCPIYDKEIKDMFKEAMQKGYIKCRLILLILVGVAGSGKTSFRHIVLDLPPPKCRVSTPLAEAAVRSMSVCHVAIDNEEEWTWRFVSSEEFHDRVADAIKKGVPLEPRLDVYEEKPESSSSVMPKHNVDPQGSEETKLESNPLQEPSSLKKKNVDLGHFSPEISAALDSITPDVDMLEKISSSSGSGKLLDINWVYIVDSGGQPQFREMLPHFVRDCSVFVMMQKLNESLGCATNIEYRVEGGKMCGAPYQSQLTNEQILYQYFQAIQSHKSRVFVVGTFRDEEHKCSDEPRAAKDEKLLAAFRPVLGDKLVLYQPCKQPGNPDQFIFPLNCKIREIEKTDPKDDSEITAQKFRQSVMKYCLGEEVKIPLPWFMFDGLLKQFEAKIKKKVLDLKECYVLAEKVHMSPRMCTAALKFLSRLNIVFYRPSILPNVVFSDSQAVLDTITELVRCRRDLPSGGEWLDFRDKGKISVKLLKEKRFSKHYREGLFEAKHFLDLLKGMLLAASLGNDEYFMPSLLHDLKPEDIMKKRVLAQGHPAPMSIRYVNTWLPVGLVPSLVADLQNHRKWEPKLKCMYHNCMQFKLPGGKTGSITLIDSIEFLEIHLNAKSKDVVEKICPKIRANILDSLQEAHISLHCGEAEVEEGFLCSGECGEEAVHFAALDDEEEMWTCSLDSDTGSDLCDGHTVWLNANGHKHTLQGFREDLPTDSAAQPKERLPSTEDRPTLPQLIYFKLQSGSINIMEQIGARYNTLGPLLLEDTDGAITEGIEKQCHHVVYDINLKILQRWIQGKGRQPVQWSTLIDVLKKIQLSELAKKIEEVLW